jgi:hypothetical protein
MCTNSGSCSEIIKIDFTSSIAQLNLGITNSGICSEIIKIDITGSIDNKKMASWVVAFAQRLN